MHSTPFLFFLALDILFTHFHLRTLHMSAEVLGLKSQRPQKHAFEDVDSDALPGGKRAWGSAPLMLTLSTHQPSEEPTLTSVACDDQVKVQHPSRYGENVNCDSGTSQSSRPGISRSLYRGTIYPNYFTLDYSGGRFQNSWRRSRVHKH